MFKKLIGALCILVICVLLEVCGKLFEKHPISFASLSFGADGSKERKATYTTNYGPTSSSLFKHQGSLYDDKFLKTKDQYPFKQYVSTPKDDKYKSSKSKQTKNKYDGIANYFKHLHGDDHNFHKDILKNDHKNSKHKEKNRYQSKNTKNNYKSSNINPSPIININLEENASLDEESKSPPHDFLGAPENSGENLKNEEIKKTPEVHKITLDPHEFSLSSSEITSHKFENNLLKILYEGLKTYKNKKPKETDDKKYPFKYLDDSHEIKTTSSSLHKEKQKGTYKSHYFSGINNNKMKEKPDYDFFFNKHNDSKKHLTNDNKKPFSVFEQEIFKNDNIKVNPNYFSDLTTEKNKFDFWLSSKPTVGLSMTPKNKHENLWFSGKPSKQKEKVEDSWFSTKSLFGIPSKMKDYGWFSSKPSYLSHTDSPQIKAKPTKDFPSTTPTNLNIHDVSLFETDHKGTPESALLFENSPNANSKPTQKPKFHFQSIFGDNSSEKDTSTTKPSNQPPKISLEIAYGTKGKNGFEPFFSIGTKNKGSSEEKTTTTTTKAPKKSKKKDKKKKKKKKSKKNKKSKKSKCKSKGSSEEDVDCDDSSKDTSTKSKSKKKKKHGKNTSSNESSENNKQVIWHNNGIKINLDNVGPKYSEETESSVSSEWKEFDEYVHKRGSKKRKKKNKSKKKKGISFVYFSPN